MAWAGSASAASRSVLQSATLWARATAARRSASRPVSSKRGTNRSWPSASPPSAMIGIKAFARCWVEPMRPVAPLTMMPIVWLAIVQFRCVAEGEGRSPLEHIPVGLMQHSAPACITRGLDPRVHHSSQELFAKRMGCRVNPGNDEFTALDYAMPLACVSTFRESKVPRHIVCLSFDFDTQLGFLARGMTSPTARWRGEFGLIGAQRILGLLKSHGIRATWFVPGFTIESHPRACEALLRDGHEVAHHSWAHVPPAQQTRAEE